SPFRGRFSSMRFFSDFLFLSHLMKRAVLTLCATFGFALALLADSAAYRQALDQGKALLEKGDHEAAFQRLQAAVAADPSDYESYFHLAVVSYRLGYIPAAQEYGREALSRAPQAAKEELEELMKVIGERLKFDQHELAGDEAFNEALM